MTDYDYTKAERQEKFRQEKAKDGLKEVRGIYLPVRYHDNIKHYARIIKQEIEKNELSRN